MRNLSAQFHSSPDPILDQLMEEISRRLEAGRPLPMEEIEQLSPAQRSEVERLLPLMEMLASAGRNRSADGTADSARLCAVGPVNPTSPREMPLGDFRLVREIGHGGMGIVFEAEQLSLARRVAVKVLPYGALWPETALQRFHNEVRIAALLEHSHIVPIYAVGCERGVHFYAMKLIDGCSLADVIRYRQVDFGTALRVPKEKDPRLGESHHADDTQVASVTAAVDTDRDWYRAAARLGRDAAAALAFAHQQGVVHRDIKPSNLLLDRTGRLFVADFGLAHAQTDLNLTRTGDVLGTPRYMSPEQAAGDSKQLDQRTDIFSLGAALYELLTRRPVITADGRAGAMRELRELHVIPPHRHDPDIPLALERIVLKCLQTDPRDRYRSAGELAQDLGRFLDGRPVAARLPGLARRATRLLQRHPQTALGLITALSLCLVASAIGFWFAQQTPRGPPSGEFDATSHVVSSPIDLSSPQEPPDMLHSSPTNNPRLSYSRRKSPKRSLGMESLERRFLMAQLSFGIPVNLGPDVNSEAIEEAPTTTGDGLSLVFGSSRSGDETFRSVFEATRATTDVPFGNVVSAGPGVISGEKWNHPAVSFDGLTLLFSSVPGTFSGRLYQATRYNRNEPFGAGVSLGDLVGEQGLASPALSADGLTLFFTVWDPSNIQNDIYQATREAITDPWGNVTALDSAINTPGYNDANPSISSDGLMLFFNSNRPGGFGAFDLYVSTRATLDSPWGNAVNLGSQVNTTSDDKGAAISADGTLLYFHSNRPGGSGFDDDDLFQVEILEITIDTKFYVVNDASIDRTYEYEETGGAIENYTLASGNTAPRGAASTAAGDKVWVVDANRKVYVYNTSGGLLGSWTAGSLASNATVEGIATNGTDIWIVDGKSDKVFKYTSAASRTSGSQNASSSFSLNSGNKDAKDIVTNGTHIWVVNNALLTDKVFKYTVGGSLVGSWTISGGGGSPTGITIDPSNVSDIWIVDSSADRVFQYTAGASRTSGSQSASASFVLAAGNTNPQGIADPPPPGAAEPASSAADGYALTYPGTHDLAISQIVDKASRPTAVDVAPVSRGNSGRLPEQLRIDAAAGMRPGNSMLSALRTRARVASEPAETTLDRILAEWDSDETLAHLLP